jgi:geranylgeranylglycerol-phosphate geranylgeranyltransferase
MTCIAEAVRLARPWNCAMSSFAMFLGAWMVARQIPLMNLLGCLACAALTTAGGNTLNDYHDCEIDRLNHPHRPIPAGRIAPRLAAYLAWAELVVGFAAGAWISVGCALIAFLAIVLLIGYEVLGLKNAGLPGNIAIGLLTALLFIMGGTVAGNMTRPVSLGGLAFLASLAREIIKDVDDMAGDMNRRTWPMRVGAITARIVSAMLLGLAVMLSPLPYLQGALSVWYLYVVAGANVVFLAAIFFIFRLPQYAARAAKLAMAGVLAAVLIGLLI